MKELITDNELNIIIEDILKNFPFHTLFEDIPNNLTKLQQTPITKQRQTVDPTLQPTKKIIKKSQIENPDINKKQINKNISDVEDKKEPEIKKTYDPDEVKQKQKMNKIQYQIFNIKMRLGKLALNDTIRRFVQSIHDFDINVTKNSKDINDIQSYLSPAQGNLVALKSVLESLETEFNELKKLLEKK